MESGHRRSAVVLGTNGHGRVAVIRQHAAAGAGALYSYSIVRDNGSSETLSRALAARILRDGGAYRFARPVPLGTDCSTCYAIGTVTQPPERFTDRPPREVRCPACNGGSAAARMASLALMVRSAA